MNLKLKNNPILKFGKEIEYVECSDNTKKINFKVFDTFKQTLNAKFQFHFKFGADNTLVFGVSGIDITDEYQIFIYQNEWYFDWRGRLNSGYAGVGGEYYLEIGNKYIKNINTGTYQIPQRGPVSQEITSGNPFMITVFRFYNLKGFVGDTLICDIVPVLFENNVYFYDKVRNTYCNRMDLNELIAGPTVGPIAGPIAGSITEKITTLYHKNCPCVDGLLSLKLIQDAQSSLPAAQKLNRVRVDIGNVSGSLGELLKFSTLAGFNDAYEPQAKPRLVGTFTINDYYTSEQLAAAQATFDGLTIVHDTSYLIDFNDLAVQTLDPEQPNYNPAVAIILNNNSKGTLLDNPVVSGGGRWFLTKAQAAAMQLGNWFAGISTVSDNNRVVTNNIDSYDFEEFDEFQYFTSTSWPYGSGKSGFGACVKLKYITIPSQITHIQYDVGMPVQSYTACGFDYCSHLERVNLDNITLFGKSNGVGGRGMVGCSSLVNIGSLNNALVSLPSFNGCEKLELSHLPQNAVSIPYSCFNRCRKITITEIPSGISVFGTSDGSIGIGTFSNCISIPYLHFLRTTPPDIKYGKGSAYEQFYGINIKFYVGDGSSAEEDNAILQAYLANYNWETYSGKLDTWYNYLHPSE